MPCRKRTAGGGVLFRRVGALVIAAACGCGSQGMPGDAGQRGHRGRAGARERRMPSSGGGPGGGGGPAAGPGVSPPAEEPRGRAVSVRPAGPRLQAAFRARREDRRGVAAAAAAPRAREAGEAVGDTVRPGAPAEGPGFRGAPHGMGVVEYLRGEDQLQRDQGSGGRHGRQWCEGGWIPVRQYR